jgi:hypothetical protein
MSERQSREDRFKSMFKKDEIFEAVDLKPSMPFAPKAKPKRRIKISRPLRQDERYLGEELKYYNAKG